MASYRNAIEWIAFNDDTEFLEDEEHQGDDMSMSVTLSMVADLWGKTQEQAVRDLRNALKRIQKEHAKVRAAFDTGLA